MKNEKYNISNPNESFFYRGNDIIKLWEQYLKSFNPEIKFYEEEGFFDSLFHQGSISQIKEVAIVINANNTPYQNKDGQTITLCGEIDHGDQLNVAYINQAIEQIKHYNNTHNNKIENHTIIFPYHVTSLHWNLGQINLSFSISEQDSVSTYHQ